MKNKLIVLLSILVMGMLSGCGMSEDDAKAYVQASLDAAYKGEFDAFVEITDSTPEGAKAMYEENIIHTMEAAGFAEMNLNEELTKKYEQLFFELAKAANYTVGEAIKSPEDDLMVEVIIQPMTIFTNIDEEVTEILLTKIEDMKELPDDNQITQMSFEAMYDVLSERLQAPEYSDKEVAVVVNVHKNEEGKYAISEEDMLALDSALFAIEEK